MSFASEFREFAIKGSVIDLAVGIIIGAAFSRIVDSLVKDIIMPVIGAILEAYVERNEAPADIVAQGLPADAVRRVVRLIKINEYKRRQAAVGIRITPRGFGKDWRYPITSKWNEWESVGTPPIA